LLPGAALGRVGAVVALGVVRGVKRQGVGARPEVHGDGGGVDAFAAVEGDELLRNQAAHALLLQHQRAVEGAGLGAEAPLAGEPCAEGGGDAQELVAVVFPAPPA